MKLDPSGTGGDTLVSSLAILLGVGACFSGDGMSSLESASETASAGDASEPVLLAPPPPGEIIDTQPASGWTEGSFSVSNSGAAEYELPLWVPDGRRRFQPRLALRYSSHGGNGLLGVGWALSGLSSIAPCPRTPAHDGRTENVGFWGGDAWCLDGERLREKGPISDTQREFRIEREAFARVISTGSSNSLIPPDYFKVWTKDGQILTFGGTANARMLAYPLSGRNAENPDFLRGNSRVKAAWALSRIEDRNGNSIDVVYETVESSGNRWSVEFVPKEMTYGPDRKVTFEYEARPDPVDGFRSGQFGSVHTRLARRLRTIRMFAATQVLREYRLRYEANSITARSLLTKVEECESALRSAVCLNPLVFEWSLGSYDLEVIDTNVTDVGVYAESGKRFIAGDIDGDGRDDLLYGNESNNWRMRRSTGAGFGQSTATGIGSTTDPSYRPRHRPIDYDRDGRLDLLTEVDFPGRRSFTLYRSLGTTYQTALTDTRFVQPHDYLPLFADLDGNGLPDYVAPRRDSPGDTSLRWGYRLNLGSGWGAHQTTDLETPFPVNAQHQIRALSLDGHRQSQLLAWNVPQGRYEAVQLSNGQLFRFNQFLNLPFNRMPENVDRRNLHFADVNGDGLVDAIYPCSGLSIQLGSGAGFSDIIPGPTEYLNPPPQAQHDLSVRIADFNSDGADDVLVLHPGTPTGSNDYQRGFQLYTWRNGGFVRIGLNRAAFPPGVVASEAVQPLDVNGDGLTDIAQVWSGNPNFLRLLRRVGEVPDRMIGVDIEGIGPRVSVDYTTLSGPEHTPGTCTYPLTCPTRGGSIVSTHRLPNGEDSGLIWRRFEHDYRAARADLLGRGWLGFEEHIVDDDEGNADTITRFDNTTTRLVNTGDGQATVYPFAGTPVSVTRVVINPLHWRYERQMSNTYVFELGAVQGTYEVKLRSTLDEGLERHFPNVSFDLHSRSSTFEYDDFGNVSKVTTEDFGSSRVEESTYVNDTVNWLIGLPETHTETDCTRPGDECVTRSKSFDHAANGNLEEIVVEPDDDDLLLITSIEYGANGNVTAATMTDAEGLERRASITYDPVGLYPSTFTNAAGHVARVSVHSGLGVTLDTHDANGVPTTMKYDRFGRLREINHADGYFERYMTFGPLAHLTMTPDGAGGERWSRTVILDKLGRQRDSSVLAFGGGFSTVRTGYDRRGRVTRISRPFSSGEPTQFRRFSYDHRNRITGVQDPDGAEVRHEYLGLRADTYDANGNHSYVAYRPDGFIDARYEDDPESDDPEDWLQTRFEYAPFGLVSRLVSADGTSQSMEYDRLGRRLSHTDPSTGTTTRGYNAYGELVEETDGNGDLTEYRYDVLGRIRQVISQDGQTIYKWDTANTGVGKPVNTTSADGVGILYRYDSIGRPSSVRWNVEGVQYELAYGYDEIGRLDRITYPAIPGAPATSGRLTLDYVYNEQGYLSHIKDAVADIPPYWMVDERNVAGQLTQETFGNGTESRYEYDDATGLMTGIGVQVPGTIGALALLLYGYDANRNVTSRLDVFNSRSDTYTYDELDRLVGWDASGGQTQLSATYDYDKLGNLESETVVGAPNQSAVYGYGEDGAPPHALTSRDGVRYGYDGAGRQISGPNRTVEYNGFGLPRFLTWGIEQGGPPRQTEFLYDSYGTRVIKRDQEQSVVYIGGLFERRASVGAGGTKIHNLHNIVAEGRTVLQLNRVQAAASGAITSTDLSYLHSDLQGTTTLLTGADGRRKEAGVEGVDWELFYDPWGRRIDADYEPIGNNRNGPVRQGYTGHEHEDEYGLVNMQGRIYDPQARRFLTADPFIPSPLFSQSHNRYSYVRNNPASLVDPTGFVDQRQGGTPEPVVESGPGTPIPTSGGAPDGTGGGDGGYLPSDIFIPDPVGGPGYEGPPLMGDRGQGVGIEGGGGDGPGGGGGGGKRPSPSSDDNNVTDPVPPSGGGSAGGTMFAQPKDDPNNRNLGPKSPDEIWPGGCEGSSPPAGMVCIGTTLHSDGHHYWVWQRASTEVPLLPGPFNGPYRIMVDPDTAKAFDGLMIASSYVFAAAGALKGALWKLAPRRPVGDGAGAMRRLRYEPAPYHGRVGSGVKSRGPTNGQAALDNSLQVTETSPRRIGIDPDTREFVIFDRTSDGVFHGHVRTWDDLRPIDRAFLRQEFDVSAKGKVP